MKRLIAQTLVISIMLFGSGNINMAIEQFTAQPQIKYLDRRKYGLDELEEEKKALKFFIEDDDQLFLYDAEGNVSIHLDYHDRSAPRAFIA